MAVAAQLSGRQWLQGLARLAQGQQMLLLLPCFFQQGSGPEGVGVLPCLIHQQGSLLSKLIAALIQVEERIAAV